jgi:cytochrome subunit of sulfide dehydrogenase
MLAGFADGSRPATVMHQIVRGYDADQLRAIAEYFATQRDAR